MRIVHQCERPNFQCGFSQMWIEGIGRDEQSSSPVQRIQFANTNLDLWWAGLLSTTFLRRCVYSDGKLGRRVRERRQRSPKLLPTKKERYRWRSVVFPTPLGPCIRIREPNGILSSRIRNNVRWTEGMETRIFESTMSTNCPEYGAQITNQPRSTLVPIIVINNFLVVNAKLTLRNVTPWQGNSQTRWWRIEFDDDLEGRIILTFQV